MFLNETKPPLDEVLEHYGVLGMHWGQRRRMAKAERAANKAQIDAYKKLEKEYDLEAGGHRKRNVAIGVLAVAGTAATIAVLHKSGHIKVPVDAIRNLSSDSKAERSNARKLASDARNAYKNSKVGGHTFRPTNVGNPLFNVDPKSPKGAKDFVNAGFGKNGVFNVTTMARGSKTMSDFDPSIWDVPMLALTSGR